MQNKSRGPENKLTREATKGTRAVQGRPDHDAVVYYYTVSSRSAPPLGSPSFASCWRTPILGASNNTACESPLASSADADGRQTALCGGLVSRTVPWPCLAAAAHLSIYRIYLFLYFELGGLHASDLFAPSLLSFQSSSLGFAATNERDGVRGSGGGGWTEWEGGAQDARPGMQVGRQERLHHDPRLRKARTRTRRGDETHERCRRAAMKRHKNKRERGAVVTVPLRVTSIGVTL